MRTTLALAATLFTAAAPAQAATIWALDAAGALAKIDTETRKAMPAKAVKGTDGALLAIALRPADGKLYGLTARGQLVTVDTETAMAREVARLTSRWMAPPAPPSISIRWSIACAWSPAMAATGASTPIPAPSPSMAP